MASTISEAERQEIIAGTSRLSATFQFDRRLTHRRLLSFVSFVGYKRLLSEREQIASMVLERESEAEEHRLVASTLKKSDEKKKAWRLVGVRCLTSLSRRVRCLPAFDTLSPLSQDVLVEETVADVLVEVDKNHASLKGVVENARQQLARKGEELTAYEKKFNITIKDREPPATSKKEGEKSGLSGSSAGGVLVK